MPDPQWWLVLAVPAATGTGRVILALLYEIYRRRTAERLIRILPRGDAFEYYCTRGAAMIIWAPRTGIEKVGEDDDPGKTESDRDIR